MQPVKKTLAARKNSIKKRIGDKDVLPVDTTH
jgi:hypothetical protein